MKKRIKNYALMTLAVAAIAGAAIVNLTNKTNADQPLFVASDNIALAENYNCLQSPPLNCWIPAANLEDIGYFISGFRPKSQ